MKITFLVTGKTDADYLRKGIVIYQDRLKHYVRFEMVELPALKISGRVRLMQAEAAAMEKYLAKADWVVLLDEKGKHHTSEEFAAELQKYMNRGLKHVVFVVGGAFGFAPQIREKADALLSLSHMTFSHQMIRLFFTEQLYRAFTILANEPYHNE